MTLILFKFVFFYTEGESEPWYIRPDLRTPSKQQTCSSEEKRKSAKAEHRKELLDPLHTMKHYVTAKKKSEGREKEKDDLSTLTQVRREIV